MIGSKTLIEILIEIFLKYENLLWQKISMVTGEDRLGLIALFTARLTTQPNIPSETNPTK